MRYNAIRQDALAFDNADAAAIFACAGRHVLAQFVSFADHGDMHRQIFQWIVARIGHEIVDAVGAVRIRTTAVGALVDLQKHPIFAVWAHTRVGRKRDRRRGAGDDLIGQNRGHGFHDQVDHHIALGEPRLCRCRRLGIEDRTLGGNHLNRPERSLV